MEDAAYSQLFVVVRNIVDEHNMSLQEKADALRAAVERHGFEGPYLQVLSAMIRMAGVI